MRVERVCWWLLECVERHGCVEALYVTPTDFENASIRRDFFRITSVLESAMPQIWKVYARYSRSLGSGNGFTSDAVSGWIGRLRHRAWDDARATAHLPAAQKAAVLNELDKDSKRVRHFGILSVLH